MIRLHTIRRRSVAVSPGQLPLPLTVEIRATVPNGVGPAELASLMVTALEAIAMDFGEALREESAA